MEFTLEKQRHCQKSSLIGRYWLTWKYSLKVPCLFLFWYLFLAFKLKLSLNNAIVSHKLYLSQLDLLTLLRHSSQDTSIAQAFDKKYSIRKICFATNLSSSILSFQFYDFLFLGCTTKFLKVSPQKFTIVFGGMISDQNAFISVS